jgi:hypothetical protein
MKINLKPVHWVKPVLIATPKTKSLSTPISSGPNFVKTFSRENAWHHLDIATMHTLLQKFEKINNYNTQNTNLKIQDKYQRIRSIR